MNGHAESQQQQRSGEPLTVALCLACRTPAE